MKTDEQIRRDVEEEICWEPKLENTQIGVNVHNNIATLTGFVKSYSQKQDAEKAAFRVSGVRGVADEINVKLPSAYERTDTEIAEAALNTLKWNTSIPGEKLRIKVEDGWVTLSGDVDWNFQREEARKTISKLAGVRGVINQVNVKPHVTPTEVKNKITRAFERNANLEAKNIDVIVTDDKVTLKGELDTWHERRQAEIAAWSAPGVKLVENQIVVTGYVATPEFID